MAQPGDKQSAGLCFLLTVCPERAQEWCAWGCGCMGAGEMVIRLPVPPSYSLVLTWCSFSAPTPSASAHTTLLKCLSAKPFRRPEATSRLGCTCSMRIASRWGPLPSAGAFLSLHPQYLVDQTCGRLVCGYGTQCEWSPRTVHHHHTNPWESCPVQGWEGAYRSARGGVGGGEAALRARMDDF